jgi:hypothetical protein
MKTYTEAEVRTLLYTMAHWADGWSGESVGDDFFWEAADDILSGRVRIKQRKRLTRGRMDIVFECLEDGEWEEQ